MKLNTLDDLLSLNGPELESLDIPSATAICRRQLDTEDCYSGYIAILVAMTKMVKAGREFDNGAIQFLPYEKELMLENGSGTVVFRHPDRDHCIITDWENGTYIGFVTAKYSDFKNH